MGIKLTPEQEREAYTLANLFVSGDGAKAYALARELVALRVLVRDMIAYWDAVDRGATAMSPRNWLKEACAALKAAGIDV